MKLEDLKKLCDDATPGPWGYGWSHGGISVLRTGINPKGGRDMVVPYVPDEGTAAFIAAARTYLPKLLAVAEAAKTYFDDDEQFFDGLNPKWFKKQAAVRAALAALEGE